MHAKNTAELMHHVNSTSKNANRLILAHISNISYNYSVDIFYMSNSHDASVRQLLACVYQFRRNTVTVK